MSPFDFLKIFFLSSFHQKWYKECTHFYTKKNRRLVGINCDKLQSIFCVGYLLVILTSISIYQLRLFYV